MISWTTIWMQKHSKTLSSEFKNLGNSIRDKKKPLYILLVIALLSVLREGIEIALFIYSSYISNVHIVDIALGSTIGAILGIALGIALYFGILKIFGKYFLVVTTWLLVFLASSIMSQAFGFFMNANLVPSFGSPIWDTSSILSQENFIGKFLNIFFGYLDHPAGIQVLTYLTNLTLLVFLLRRNVKKNHVL
jgi:high-affinity iron transporter